MGQLNQTYTVLAMISVVTANKVEDHLRGSKWDQRDIQVRYSEPNKLIAESKHILWTGPLFLAKRKAGVPKAQ